MLTVFAAALGACGLDYGQAADLLKCSRSTIQKKCSLSEKGEPVLPMTASDAAALRELHHKIRMGDVKDKDPSIQLAASALRILRGVEAPTPKPIGRPAKAKPVPPPPPTQKSHFYCDDESRRAVEDFWATYLEDNEDGISS